MKKELETWRHYLTEKEKPVQDNYEAHFYLALTQSKEIDWLGVAKDMELIVKSECSKFPGSMQIYCNYFLLMP